MSDHAPPAVPGHAPVGDRAEGLTPQQIDETLAAFRTWLEQAATAPEPAADEQPIDLHTLLAQFVALRHEVNLQTRASRGQMELNAEALKQLTEAVELLRDRADAAEQAREQERDEQLRPLLKVLIDLHDNLSLARREVQRAQEALASTFGTLEAPCDVRPEPEPPSPAPAVAPAPRRSLWSRLFGSAPPPPPPDAESLQPWREALARQTQRIEELARERADVRQAAARARLSFDSVVTGYTMSLQRLERALRQQGLEPIPCLGLPFDPETMEAVEVVAAPGRTGTEVIEEVRPGYRWRGRVFRFAQVRVAKPA